MLVPTRAPHERSFATPAQRAVRFEPRPGRARRVRRVAAIAAGICLVPALISYIGAVAQPSNGTLGIRTVEWLRDNGARGLVNKVESIYYSLNSPAKGGPPLRALPHQAGIVSGPGEAVHRAVRSYYEPRPIPPVIHPALRGEGSQSRFLSRLRERVPRSGG